jgi:hypothetical protein
VGGSRGTTLSSIIGKQYVNDRSSVKVSLSTHLTANTYGLAKSLLLYPRNLQSIDQDPVKQIKVFLSGGNYYEFESYIEAVDLKADPAALVDLEIRFHSWVWREYSSNLVNYNNLPFNPNSQIHKPIPGWETYLQATIVSPGTTTLSWDISISNEWQFESLLEAYLQPPNPVEAYQSNIEAKFNATFLANRGSPPNYKGACTILHKNTQTGSITNLFTIPQLLRESYGVLGIGEQGQPLKWQASYLIINETPT